MADPPPSPSPQAPSPAHPSADKPTPIQPLDVFQPETVDSLVAGFLAVLEPEMLRVQQSLQELTTNQEEMLQSIHDKRSQLEDTAKTSEIQATLQKVPVYRHKVVTVTRHIQNLGRRVKRLQQRSNKLKELRVTKDVQRRREFEKKMEQERLLEARPSK